MSHAIANIFDTVTIVPYLVEVRYCYHVRFKITVSGTAFAKMRYNKRCISLLNQPEPRKQHNLSNGASNCGDESSCNQEVHGFHPQPQEHDRCH